MDCLCHLGLAAADRGRKCEGYYGGETMDDRPFQRQVDFLLEHASPNIQYRVRKEICGEAAGTSEMMELQEKLLTLPKVKKAFACQRENGFFGSVLHGVYFDGFDATVDLLKRNGVEITNPRMVRAKEALIQWQDYAKDHFYKAGSAMDEYGRGGFRAIWAEQLVELGADESLPQIQEQISNALNAFKSALNYSSPDDFSKKAIFKGRPCRYYIKGAAFPAANHISILEKTFFWRNAGNLEMVSKSYRHCKEIMKDYHDGNIYVNCGHFVGPFNYNWNAPREKISIRSFDAHPIDFAWFMKGLSSASERRPIFDDDNPYFLESLIEMISDENLIQNISEEQMRQFKNYSSLAPSWRKKESIVCDIYFPILLALCGRRKGAGDI